LVSDCRANDRCFLGRRAGLGRGIGFDVQVNPRNEPEAAPGQRLDVPRRLGRIVQRSAKPVERVSERVVELDECVSGPEPLTEILSADQLPRTLEERRENPKRFVLEPELVAVLEQLARAEVQRVPSEAGDSGTRRSMRHIDTSCG
jgi:hypothetical protein